MSCWAILASSGRGWGVSGVLWMGCVWFVLQMTVCIWGTEKWLYKIWTISSYSLLISLFWTRSFDIKLQSLASNPHDSPLKQSPTRELTVAIIVQVEDTLTRAIDKDQRPKHMKKNLTLKVLIGPWFKIFNSNALFYVRAWAWNDSGPTERDRSEAHSVAPDSCQKSSTTQFESRVWEGKYK